MKKFLISLLLFSTTTILHAADEILERKLSLIESLYKLEPKDCKTKQVVDTNSEKIKAGEILFKSKLLSGNRDIACQTCHLDDFGSTDGLSLAVGVGGDADAEGQYRLDDGKGTLVQRNALSLIGRASPHFTSFFWDGKVDKDENGKIYSQFGVLISEKFESPLAVASMLPIIERDEFIGLKGIGPENEIQKEVGDAIYYKRYKAVSRVLNKRVLSGEDDNEILDAIKKAGVNPEKFDLSDVGNLISHFISDKFKCNESRWDEYLKGNKSIITASEKRGAVLFYGKGRCASCHSGPFNSDFRFHSIGVPQGLFGPHTRHRDLGRAAVTLNSEDLYRFRTPPLNEVSKTAPYGHNGVFPSVRDAVVHHFNPIAFYINNPDISNSTFFEIGKLNDSRHELLSSINLRSENELNDLLDFLNTL